MTKATKPRILLLDIETAPGKAYIWNMRDDGVPLERLIESGRMVCAAFKWYGVKGMHFTAEWHPGGRKGMLTLLRAALDSADAVVTYNGDHFDFQVLNAEFLTDGMKPPAPITSIDLYKTIRTMRFMSRKLEYIGPILKIGRKVKHEGFSLWRKIMEGDPKARIRFERYNKQDVRLLETGYSRIRPYIKSHPHLRDASPHSCSACGSTHVQHRGNRRTKTFRIERLQCQVCGKWDDGKRTKVK
jgi:hypothetical protein